MEHLILLGLMNGLVDAAVASLIRTEGQQFVPRCTRSYLPIIKNTSSVGAVALEIAMTHDATGSVLLVVDDEALIRMHGVATLEDAGFNVLEAANADEAIAILEQAPEIRLMFSDVDMPGSMNGVELATVVNQRWPNIRLLLTSGHHWLADATLPDHGRFISKPYNGETVLRQVGELLQLED
jgi:two-component system, response regulator PdtaR